VVTDQGRDAAAGCQRVQDAPYKTIEPRPCDHPSVGLPVLIVEDSLLVREGIVRLVQSFGHTVVATAIRAEQVLGQVARHRPRLVLMDIRLPPTHTDEGIRLTVAIRERYPGTAVLVLSQFAEPEHAATLVQQDPRSIGYLLKDRILDGGLLSAAITRLVAGETVIDRDVALGLVNRARAEGPLDELTGRERDTLALMAEGLSDRGIAERLSVSTTTVGTHVQAVFRKLGLPGSVADNRRVLAVLTYLRER
jgi:DNA-binding NarL/FixJ family response regulator